MKIIDINNEYYPEKLRNIHSPPKILYVVGDEKILNKNSIAIVGSRHCTSYGEKQATIFSKELTKQGLQIVSGLAIGIDTNAHKGCITAKGKTIAVLGCGFNKLYPKENKYLFDKIIETGGAIISEYSPNVEPSSEKFRNRNRIVSGLSLATLIIEAAYRSGTTITARYAKEQGKPIFCIPNSLENNKGIGTNELLKKGALLATNIDDILTKCNIQKVVGKINKEIIEEKNVNKEYKKIYSILTDIPINTNEISKKLNIAISEVNSKLLLMEMEGLVKKLVGNEYIKI